MFSKVFLVLPGLPLAIVIAAYLPASPATGGARAGRDRVGVERARRALADPGPASSRLRGGVRWWPGNRISAFCWSRSSPTCSRSWSPQVIGSTVYAIGAQVGLEFLGLGDVSSVSWGTILYWAQNDSALLTGAWWTFVPAGLCVALVGFGLTLLNSGFDEITNPRLTLEHAWRAYLVRHGQAPGRSTPVVREHA
jgi:peptide/nickel transport system permease protein